MGSASVAVLLWTLVSLRSRGPGGGEAWPTHMACSSGGLEVLYESCDPLQDFGLSIDQCSKQLQSYLNIRFGIILKEDIRELFLDIALVTKGSFVLNFSYPICEEDLPKFSFCGRRKGDSHPGGFPGQTIQFMENHQNQQRTYGVSSTLGVFNGGHRPRNQGHTRQGSSNDQEKEDSFSLRDVAGNHMDIWDPVLGMCVLRPPIQGHL